MTAGSADPLYGILASGLSDQDDYWTNSGEINAAIGGIQPYAVTTSGAVHVISKEGEGVFLQMPILEVGTHFATPWLYAGMPVTDSEQPYAMYTYDVAGAASIGTPGSPPPGGATLIAGSDGTDMRVVLTDSTGKVEVLDTVAEGYLSTIATDMGKFTFDGMGNLNVTSSGGGGSDTAPTGSPVPADANYIAGNDNISGDLTGVSVAGTGFLPGFPPGALITNDQWLYEESQIDSFSGQYIQGVGGFKPDMTPQALLFDSSGNLLVSSSGGGGGGGVVSGSDGVNDHILKTDVTGRLRVLVDSMGPVEIIWPEDVDFPDAADDAIGPYTTTAFATKPATPFPAPLSAMAVGAPDDTNQFRPFKVYSGVGNAAYTGFLRVLVSPDPFNAQTWNSIAGVPVSVTATAAAGSPLATTAPGIPVIANNGAGNGMLLQATQGGGFLEVYPVRLPGQVSLDTASSSLLAVPTTAAAALALPQNQGTIIVGSDSPSSQVAGLARWLRTDSTGRLRVVVDTDPFLEALLEGALDPIPVTLDGNITVAPVTTAVLPPYGQASVAVTGTPVRLPDQTFTQSVTITAHNANFANIYIGNSVVAQTFTGLQGGGYELAPGASISLPLSQLNVFWINGTALDGVSWIGV